MLDPVKPCSLLVVAAENIPWCWLVAGRLKHCVPRPRIFVPARKGFEVHGAELPLPKRVFNPCAEPAFLLLHPHFEPELEQDHPALDQPAFELGDVLEKS